MATNYKENIPADAERTQHSEAGGTALSQQTLHSILDTLDTAVIVLDEQAVISFANKSFTVIFGYEPDELLQKGLGLILLPESVSRIEQSFRQGITPGTRVRGELDSTCPNGKSLTVQFTLSLADGTAPGNKPLFSLVLQDISKTRQTEDRLRKSENFSQLIAKSITDFVAFQSESGEFLYVSPSVTRLTGWSEQDVIGKEIENLIHSADAEAYRECFGEVITTGSARTVEWRLRRRNGAFVWLETILQPVREDEDDVRQVLSSSREITERKLAEEEKKRYSEVLRASRDMIVQNLRELAKLNKQLSDSEANLKVLVAQRTEELEKSNTQLAKELKVRKAAQKELKLINEQLEERIEQRTREINSLIEQSPYAIAVYDNSGRRLTTNQTWSSLSSSSMEGNLFNLSLMQQEGYVDKLRQLCNEGGILKTEPVALEEGGPDSGDNPQVFTFTFYAITNGPGDVHRIVMMVEDITDQLKKEEMNRELALQRERSAAMLTILEEERGRFARELHDVIGQKLLLSKLSIDLALKKSAEETPDLEEAKRQIIEISKDIKAIIHSLRPAVIEKYGLVDALQLLIQKFFKNTEIQASINFYGSPDMLPKTFELNIYRIVQESINNIVRHANADTVRITLHFNPGLIIGSIEDNGEGFDVSLLQSGSGYTEFGIIGMTERAKAMGGDLEIDSAPGEGTTIHFEIPVKR